jgi:hypothetical protein
VRRALSGLVKTGHVQDLGRGWRVERGTAAPKRWQAAAPPFRCPEQLLSAAGVFQNGHNPLMRLSGILCSFTAKLRMALIKP